MRKQYWLAAVLSFMGAASFLFSFSLRAETSARATCDVTMDGKTFSNLRANSGGAFQKIEVPANQAMTIQIAYEGGREGEQVVAEALDGGKIEGDKQGHVFKLDAQGKLTFTFRVDEAPGIYQIALHKGGDEKLLKFWVPIPSKQAAE